ncbi:MAG TPA: methylated-DNA--[protein]-cysteine S-methyltransferase [Reyranella sp.]|jgi:AraC family transcriptional regulator, regulatory protein of adaptative response / methylated-DNA-[protein]-cysteine methyltransferase|nr:methylated-DNA--[protein]-cysteine S-methyltransferase [Reyranella sp.]
MAPAGHHAPRDGRNARPVHAAAEVIRYGFSQTSVGTILLAESVRGIVAIAIREHPDEDALLATVRARFPHAVLRHDRTGTRKAVAAVVGFVEGPRGNIALPLDIRGTEFQRRVWAAVMKIPFAKTTNFAEIARTVGSPRAVRAVGNACSQNPLEFAIPCHRVLRSDGSYSGGSAWGDRRQSTVLRREAQWLASMGAKLGPRRAAKGPRP